MTTFFFYILELVAVAAVAYLGARAGATVAAESNFTSLQNHLMTQDTHLDKLTTDVTALGTQLTQIQTDVGTNTQALRAQISDQATQIQTLRDALAAQDPTAIDAALDGLDTNVLAMATTASAIGALVAPPAPAAP